MSSSLSDRMKERKNSASMEYMNLANSDMLVLKMDAAEQAEFDEFCDARVSYKTLRMVTLVFALVNAYIYSMALVNAKSRIFIAAIAGTLYCIRNPFVVLLIYVKKRVREGSDSEWLKGFMPWFPFFTNILAVHSVLGLGLFLIARVLNGKCESLNQLHVWGCNSEFTARALPQDVLFCLFFLPVMYSTIFKAVRLNFILICWLICVACTGIAIALGNATQSLATYFIYIPVSLVVIYENHRQNVIVFRMAKKQHALYQANKSLSEEAQNELRFMIANMAHDLKTPLSAFMNGVETLSSVFSDMKRSPPGNNHNAKDYHNTRDFHRIIKDNIKNLFNVNNFMTMTVNRCIDYMKASKGIKLEPRLETINLQEVLSMPLNCMRDLQSRIAIIQRPIPPSVCTHIITDLQWFQENLFCLISNAVKYSSQGHISVGVALVNPNHTLILAAKEQSKKRISIRENETPIRSPPPEMSNHLHPERYTFLDRLVLTTTTSNNVTTEHVPSSNYNDSERTVSLNDAINRMELGLRQNQTSPKTTIKKKVKNQSPFSSFSFTRKSNKVYAAPLNEATEQITRAPPPLISPSGEVLEQFILIEVEDTGIGLSDEVKNSLFAPFKQAQRRAGGTGLGLYSLAKRVDALGGYYGMTSRSDGQQGSDFWFAIPYRPDVAASLSTETRSSHFTMNGMMHESECSEESSGEKDPIPQLVSSTSTVPPSIAPSIVGVEVSPPPAAQKLRILLVDDSVPILKMTSNLLKRQGHTVDQEENGADALARLEIHRNEAATPYYDVMLIDLNMPVMDGLEAMKRLRDKEKRASTDGIVYHQKVFAFSANSDHETMMEAMEAGADDFICKPFSIQTFNEKIHKSKSISTSPATIQMDAVLPFVSSGPLPNSGGMLTVDDVV